MPRFIAAALALLAWTAPALAEAEGAVRVMLNHAHVMRLPAKTSTVIVGNPLIADVNLQRNGIVVVTGKSYGTTNLVVLDGAGAIVSESLINVMPARSDPTVLVQRGMERETYSCNPQCLPSIRLGDSEKYFGDTGKQVEQFKNMSIGK